MAGRTIADVAIAGDLASVVHRHGRTQVATRERTEIDHPAGPRPGERMDGSVANSGTRPDDLTAGVDSIGVALAAAEGAEVDHPFRLRPGERMRLDIAGGRAVADDLAAGIDRPGLAPQTTEGPEIDHPAGPRPGERMKFEVAIGRETRADDLAHVVHRHGLTKPTAEGAEVDHPFRLRPGERMRFDIARGVTLADDLAHVVHRHSIAVGAAEGAEIDHPACWRPRECTESVLWHEAEPHDLTADVHRCGSAKAYIGAAEGTEIDRDEEYSVRRSRVSRDRGEENREHQHENGRDDAEARMHGTPPQNDECSRITERRRVNMQRFA